MSIVAAGALVTALAGRSSSAGSDADADIKPHQITGRIDCGLSNEEDATGTPIKVGAISTQSGGIDFSSSPKVAPARH